MAIASPFAAIEQHADHMADGSLRVVYAALIGNILVATAKFGAAAVSGSSAMLTEAIHSSADSINQLLLLVGNRRGKRRRDRTHPFGYGMEIYFWTFVVGVLVFLAGGAASIWQGVSRLADREEIYRPGLSLVVLALSALFEGTSFVIGYRESRRVAALHPGNGAPVSLWKFIKLSKDPNLYESLLEDGAALIGITFAALGVIGSAYLGWRWADGAASIGIGLLLIAASIVILRATQSLIGGEAVTPALMIDLKKVLDGSALPRITEVATLHLGPRQIMVALTIDPSDGSAIKDLPAELENVQSTLKKVDQRFAQLLIRFSQER